MSSMKKTVLSAMFIAIGIVLPFFTGQLQQIGSMLLPMHIPVFLCGLICGWQYGAAAGFILPLMRSLIFTMPTLFPNALSMAFELCFYGLIAGLIYGILGKKNVLSVYISLVSAMIVGRVAWGTAQLVFLSATGGSFTWQMFAAGALFNAFPGMILQLILIPAIMTALHLTGTIRFGGREK